MQNAVDTQNSNIPGSYLNTDGNARYVPNSLMKEMDFANDTSSQTSPYRTVLGQSVRFLGPVLSIEISSSNQKAYLEREGRQCLDENL